MNMTHPQIQDILSQIIFLITQRYSHIFKLYTPRLPTSTIQDVVYKYNTGGNLKYSLSQ